MLLTAAFGFTALAVSGMIPSSFISTTAEGDAEPTVTTLTATPQVANNGSIADYPAPDSFSFTFNCYFDSDTNEGGLTLVENPQANVVVKKGTVEEVEGNKVFTPSDETVNFTLEANGKNLTVKFAEGLKDGAYQVTLPAGVVSGKRAAEDTDVVYNAETVTVFNVAPNYLPLRDQQPARDAVIGADPGISSMFFQLLTGKEDGFFFIPNTNAKVTVTKDGEPFATYTIGVDTENVYQDSRYNERLMINFGQTLEPGVYVVTVPSHVLTAPIAGESSIEDAGEGVNPEMTGAFTVVKNATYTTIPAQGSQVMPSQLADLQIVFPENSTVTVNDAAGVAYFEEVNVRANVGDAGGASHTKLTECTLSANGNIVTVKADAEMIKPFSDDIKYKYDVLVIPEGVVTVTLNGETLRSLPMTVGNYAVRNITADAFKFEPALDAEGIDLRTLKEIKMTLPEGCKWAVAKDVIEGSNNAMITVYTKPYTGQASYGFKFKSVSTDGRTYTLVPVTPTSAIDATNNFDFCQEGPAAIRILKGKIDTGVIDANTNKAITNSQLDIDAWNLVGIAYDPIFKITSPNTGTAVTSITSVTLNALRPVVVADENAEITLSKDGVAIKSVKVSETTTSAAKVGGAGSATVTFKDCFKKEDGSAFTEKGVYSFHVPAGAFQQKGSEWKTNEVDFQVYIVPESIEFTANPAPATVTGTISGTTVSDFNCVANADFTSLNSIEFTFPGAKKIALGSNLRNALQNSGIGRVTAKNGIEFANGKKTSVSPIAPVGYSADFKLQVVGDNKLKVSFNEYIFATPKDYLNAFTLYKGAIVLTYDEDGKETEYANPTFSVLYQPLPLPAPKIVSFNDAAPVATSYLTTIHFEATESIYNRRENKKDGIVAATATLTNEAGEVVANYTSSDNPDPAATAELEGPTPKNFWFHTTADLSELPAGKYTFTIPEHALQANSKTPNSATTVFNTTPFVYDVTIKNFTEPTVVSPTVESTNTSFSFVTLSYKSEGGGSTGSMEVNSEISLIDRTAVAKFYKDGVVVKEIDADSSALQYAVEGAPNDITFVFDVKGTTESGTYKLEVPQGMFLVGNGVKNAAFSGEWTVEGPVKYTTNPAEGKVTELNSFEITFPEFTEITSGIKTVSFDYPNVDYAPDSTQDQYKTGTANVSFSGNVATVTIPDTYANINGEYSFSFSANSFQLSNGETAAQRGNTAFAVKYVVAAANDVTTLTPAPGEVTAAQLENIVLTLPEGNKFGMLMLNNATQAKSIIRVFEEDSNGQIPSDYNQYTATSNNQFVGTYMASVGFSAIQQLNAVDLKFTPAKADFVMEAGKSYQIVIIGGKLTTKSAAGTTNTDPNPMFFRYTVAAAPATFDLSEGMELAMPASTEFTSEENPYGPTRFAWYVDGADIALNADNKENWTVTTVMDGETVPVFEVTPETISDYAVIMNGEKVDFNYGTGGLAEGDVDPEPAPAGDFSTLVLDLSSVEGMAALANMPGDYTVTIPAGALKKGNALNEAFQITYRYTTVAYSGDDKYEFTPAVETTVANLEKITITFPESKYVNYLGNGKVTLAGPDGLTVESKSYPAYAEGMSSGDEGNQSLTWDFTGTKWVDGIYTLNIPKGLLTINDPNGNYNDEGNVPAITAVWTVDTETGVTLIGIDAADSYNVFTVDGAAVRLNATPAELLELEQGIYVINGQKVYVRK